MCYTTVDNIVVVSMSMTDPYSLLHAPFPHEEVIVNKHIQSANTFIKPLASIHLTGLLQVVPHAIILMIVRMLDTGSLDCLSTVCHLFRSLARQEEVNKSVQIVNKSNKLCNEIKSYPSQYGTEKQEEVQAILAGDIPKRVLIEKLQPKMEFMVSCMLFKSQLVSTCARLLATTTLPLVNSNL